MLDENACADAILQILEDVAKLTPMQVAHGLHVIPGKLYELYCLARVLEALEASGHTIAFTGSALTLKASGGFADPGAPHFEVYKAAALIGRVYTDVEVGCLSAGLGPVADYSAYHEIDVVMLEPDHAQSPQRPAPGELLLGVECKAVADFDKAFVREVLGRRRELSFYDAAGAPGLLGFEPADPPSAYWLAYIDPRGDHYVDGPAVFGVRLHHWAP